MMNRKKSQKSKKKMSLEGEKKLWMTCWRRRKRRYRSLFFITAELFSDKAKKEEHLFPKLQHTRFISPCWNSYHVVCVKVLSTIIALLLLLLNFSPHGNDSKLDIVAGYCWYLCLSIYISVLQFGFLFYILFWQTTCSVCLVVGLNWIRIKGTLQCCYKMWTSFNIAVEVKSKTWSYSD